MNSVTSRLRPIKLLTDVAAFGASTKLAVAVAGDKVALQRMLSNTEAAATKVWVQTITAIRGPGLEAAFRKLVVGATAISLFTGIGTGSAYENRFRAALTQRERQG